MKTTLILVCGLAGCAPDSTPVKTETPDPASQASPVPQPAGAAEFETDDLHPLDTASPEDTGNPEESLLDSCFAEIAGDGTTAGPDYSLFQPTVGSHCQGTNHQDIQGVERVVFLGDSVTVGTPPSTEPEFYRNQVADDLAAEFGLERPNWFWQSVNPFDGVSYIQESGDFASCAKWGARTDDLMRDNAQVQNCLPEDKRHLKTLVVMTIGGNDLANLTQGFQEGRPVADLWDQTRESMALMREAVEWITAPGTFPNGVWVVFTNLYEFTDGTGDTGSCPAAALAGMGDAITDPALADMVIWSMEEFLSIAVDTRTDMLFLLESFCGHGYSRDDPNARCYRGPDTELWFDLTCIHPNPTGHRAIADMMMSVVRE